MCKVNAAAVASSKMRGVWHPHVTARAHGAPCRSPKRLLDNDMRIIEGTVYRSTPDQLIRIAERDQHSTDAHLQHIRQWMPHCSSAAAAETSLARVDPERYEKKRPR
jgi:hypothetical protein